MPEHLRQIGLAFHNFHDANDGFPPSRMPASGATWPLLALPFVEQDPLFQTWDLTRPYHTQRNPAAVRTAVAVYACPGRRAGGNVLSGDGRGPIPHRPGARADYAACLGSDPAHSDQDSRGGAMFPGLADGGRAVGTDPYSTGISWRVATRIASVTDGTSNTTLVGEKHVRPGGYGTVADGDSSAYNGDNWNPVGRWAGLGNPLVANPTRVCACSPWPTGVPGRGL